MALLHICCHARSRSGQYVIESLTPKSDVFSSMCAALPGTLYLILVKTNSKVHDVVQHQGHVDFVRYLLVKIKELVEGPYGPRIDVKKSTNLTRLGKLLKFADRAQALWPTCSSALAEALDSEYLSVKEELTEEDREADIDSYLEDMRGSQY